MTAKVKLLDLANLIRDAFLAGRGLKDGDKLTPDDQAALCEYDPTNLACYQRIDTVLYENRIKRHVVWQDKHRTIGIITEDSQMAYELRKGALNPLGIVTLDFCEAWAEMTANDECWIEEVRLP